MSKLPSVFSNFFSNSIALLAVIKLRIVLAFKDARRNEMTSRPTLSVCSTLTDEPMHTLVWLYMQRIIWVMADLGLQDRHVPCMQVKEIGRHFFSTTEVGHPPD
jgi:hypothetical protein